MNFDIVKQQVGRYLDQHGATILTAGGVIGTVTTAVLAARASLKASESLQVRQDEWEDAAAKYSLEHDNVGALEPLKQTDKLKAVAPHYVPPIVVGTLTVASIVGANMVSARKAATLAAAYALTDERFAEYRAKVSGHLTGPKQQKVLDQIAQDKVDAVETNIVIVGDAEVLCFDALSGRYFKSTMEKIKRAELEIKEELYNHSDSSLSEFYQKVGLDPTTYSEGVGWNLDNAIELSTHATIKNDRPCIVVDFAVLPKPDYHRTY